MRTVRAQATFLVCPLSRMRNTMPEIRLAAIRTKARAIIHFMTRIIPTLAAIILIALTASLGQWQLRRADYKEQLALARASASVSEPPEVLELMLADGSLRTDTEAARAIAATLPYGIRTRLQGHWLPDTTVFIDNRTFKGVAGFHVVSAFAVERSSLILAINRGWVARDIRDRSRLPKLKTPGERLSLEAWIEKPQKAMELGGSDPGQTAASGDNAGLWQNFDVARMSVLAKANVAPWLLRQSNSQSSDGASPDGLNRDWPAPANDVAKHQGYAFQWFSLAGLTALLWLWFVLIKPKRLKRIAERDSD
jgi:surfeit locus 1 family protein